MRAHVGLVIALVAVSCITQVAAICCCCHRINGAFEAAPIGKPKSSKDDCEGTLAGLCAMRHPDVMTPGFPLSPSFHHSFSVYATVDTCATTLCTQQNVPVQAVAFRRSLVPPIKRAVSSPLDSGVGPLRPTVPLAPIPSARGRSSDGGGSSSSSSLHEEFGLPPSDPVATAQAVWSLRRVMEDAAQGALAPEPKSPTLKSQNVEPQPPSDPEPPRCCCCVQYYRASRVSVMGSEVPEGSKDVVQKCLLGSAAHDQCKSGAQDVAGARKAWTMIHYGQCNAEACEAPLTELREVVIDELGIRTPSAYTPGKSVVATEALPASPRPLVATATTDDDAENLAPALPSAAAPAAGAASAGLGAASNGAGIHSGGVAAVAATGSRAAARHVSSSPPPTITKLVVSGDLHGDFETLKRLLKSAGLLNKDGQFSPPADTAVALLGDYFDRGHQDQELFDWLYEARATHPNHLYMVLGNHESLILAGDMRYTTSFTKKPLLQLRDQSKAAEGYILDTAFKARVSLQTCEGELNKKLRSLPSMLAVGNTLIAHGGPSLEWTRYLQNQHGGATGDKLLQAYNTKVREELKEACQAFEKLVESGVPDTPAAAIDGGNYRFKYLSGSPNLACGNTGPAWFRGWSEAQEDDEKYSAKCCVDTTQSVGGRPQCRYRPAAPFVVEEVACAPSADADATAECDPGPKALTICEAARIVLEAFGVDRIIMAHTIQKEGIRQLCEGRLIFVDVSLSEFMRRPGRGNPRREYLLLETGKTPRRMFFDGAAVEPVKFTPLDRTPHLGGISCADTVLQFPAKHRWCRGGSSADRAPPLPPPSSSALPPPLPASPAKPARPPLPPSSPAKLARAASQHGENASPTVNIDVQPPPVSDRSAHRRVKPPLPLHPSPASLSAAPPRRRAPSHRPTATVGSTL